MMKYVALVLCAVSANAAEHNTRLAMSQAMAQIVQGISTMEAAVANSANMEFDPTADLEAMGQLQDQMNSVHDDASQRAMDSHQSRQDATNAVHGQYGDSWRTNNQAQLDQAIADQEADMLDEQAKIDEMMAGVSFLKKKVTNERSASDSLRVMRLAANELARKVERL